MILQRFLIRLVTMIVTLFGVSVVVFVIIRVAPGDPIAMMLPPGATQADIDRLRALYGLDRSIIEQYFIWLGGVLEGNFGTSISLRQDVMSLVLSRLPATLELSVAALLIAILIGVPLAILGAREQGTAVEASIDVANGAALSIPDFLWGLVLILLFGVLAPVFHISGRISPQLDLPFATQFYLIESILRLRFDLTRDLIGHMFMPALALALPLAAIISQLLKMSLKEVMTLDYVTLARVKGFSETQVILREALKNAALPTLALIGVQFTFLIGGTVIVERLFSYEGLGNMAIDAVINRDLPLIQGIVLVFALLFVLINLAVDMMYALLNPRLRNG
jgi:peptide/nickel transport system permease protein